MITCWIDSVKELHLPKRISLNGRSSPLQLIGDHTIIFTYLRHSDCQLGRVMTVVIYGEIKLHFSRPKQIKKYFYANLNDREVVKNRFCQKFIPAELKYITVYKWTHFVFKFNFHRIILWICPYGTLQIFCKDLFYIFTNHLFPFHDTCSWIGCYTACVYRRYSNQSNYRWTSL